MSHPPAAPQVRSVTATEYKASGGRHTVYAFEIHYAGFMWVVHKRFNEVADLLEDLKAHYRSIGLDFPFPLPKSKFFGRFEPEFVHQRAQELLGLLRNIAASPAAWRSEAARQFFEVSVWSFRRALGPKAKEGWIRKKSGGRKVVSDGRLAKLTPWETWKRRWVVLKGAPD